MLNEIVISNLYNVRLFKDIVISNLYIIQIHNEIFISNLYIAILCNETVTVIKISSLYLATSFLRIVQYPCHVLTSLFGASHSSHHVSTYINKSTVTSREDSFERTSSNASVWFQIVSLKECNGSDYIS